MPAREIVKIDEDLCDGCGKCIPACAEGALQIVDGKARLVSDVYCDGLGDCLGECPQGAISIEKRKAADFNPHAVRLKLDGEEASLPGGTAPATPRCKLVGKRGEPGEKSEIGSLLGNWPIQIKLLPSKAPYFDGADLLISADCVPFSFADFHRRFLPGKVLLVGCPKLDSADFYRRKLAQIFMQNDIRSVEVIYMEVPCCFGMVHLVHESLKESGKEIPLSFTKLSVEGEILETVKARDEGGEK